MGQIMLKNPIIIAPFVLVLSFYKSDVLQIYPIKRTAEANMFLLRFQLLRFQSNIKAQISSSYLRKKHFKQQNPKLIGHKEFYHNGEMSRALIGRELWPMRG